MKKISPKIFSALLSLFFVINFVLPSSQVFAHNRHHGEEMVDIIVTYYDGKVPDEENLDPAFEDVRTSRHRPVQAMTVPASAIKEMMENESVEQIRYNQIVTTSEAESEVEEITNNPDSDQAQTAQSSGGQWNTEMIHANRAWDEGITGSGVNVAVIDTGFSEEHSDINFTGGASIFDDEPWNVDYSGHGTHVAGIIGAEQGTPHQGVAPGVNLYGVKIYNSEDRDENGNNHTTVDNLIEGFIEAMNLNPQIIVISSGFANHDADLHGYIQSAINSGILVVAASGNGESNVEYPAAYPEVVAVSSVNQNQDMAQDSIYSEDELNELAAPGVSITSLWNDGGYHTSSGSSQAAPHVAGTAALFMQKYGSSASETRSMMQENALELETFNSHYWGHGLVQYDFDDTDESEEDDSNPGEETPSEEDEEENENGDNEEVDSPDPSENGGTQTEDPEPEENEDASDENTEDTPSQPDEEETEADQDSNEDEEEEETSRAVWVRPNETDGRATVDDQYLGEVADGGTLAVSFDSSIDHITELYLSAEQIEDIRERELSVLIAKREIEWVMPSENFSEGEASLLFQPVENDLPNIQSAEGTPYAFELIQNETTQTDFSEEMVYRFALVEESNEEELLYEYSSADETWNLLGETYSNGFVVGTSTNTGIFSTFLPTAFEEEEAASSNAAEADDSNDEETEETSSGQAGIFANLSPGVLSLVGLVVIGGSIGGGFYYFGKNK